MVTTEPFPERDNVFIQGFDWKTKDFCVNCRAEKPFSKLRKHMFSHESMEEQYWLFYLLLNILSLLYSFIKLKLH